MDPRHLQNTLNPGGGAMDANQQNAFLHPQYNQFFAQNQLLSQGFYPSQQQMLDMQYMQQQQLLHMQQQLPQQHQQSLQQPQLGLHPNSMLQQQQLLQQQHLPQFQQVAQQMTHQQRLLDQQKQQMEAIRQQRLAQERAEAEARLIEQQKREAEEAEKRRIAEEIRRKEEAERLAKLEAEMLERRKMEEEAARQAEIERLRLEAERREREQLEKVQAEQQAKAREAEKNQHELEERGAKLPAPYTMLGTPITNLLTLISFPSENLANSQMLRICQPNELGALNNTDPTLVANICDALAACDVNDIKMRQDFETNETAFDQLPPLIKAVLQHRADALDVETSMAHGIDLGDINDAMNTDFNLDRPSETSAAPRPMGQPTDPARPAFKPAEIAHPDGEKIRRQMISLGKQPKAAQNQRKKKDMVAELYDSLTDYFDPSQGPRSRRKAKTFEEELQDKKDLEMVERMEHDGDESEHDPEAAGPSSVKRPFEEDELDGKFFDKRKSKKRKHEEFERAPTPTEVIQEREAEWIERQRQRNEKRRRNRGDDSGEENWSNDVMAEQASQECFEATIDQIVNEVDIEFGRDDQDDDDNADMDAQCLIEASKLEQLRMEALKLKEWKKLNKVNADRLVKLITILERNIRDVIPREGEAPIVSFLDDETMDDDDQATLDERLYRAAAAACTALLVMTGSKMPKMVFLEDAIDRSIQLCKQYLNYIVFPASDSVFRSPNKQKKVEEKSRGRRKLGQSTRTPSAQRIYVRMTDLIGCFGELVRVQSLSEMSIHHLSTIATSAFFVNNIGELQWQAMRLLSNIFNKCDDNIRHAILQDIINALHRLPHAKTTSNSLRLSTGTWLNNVSVLIMQLVQATVHMPKRKKRDGEETDEKAEIDRADKSIKSSFESAYRIAATFLGGFLQKCCSKGEEDNRRVFESFLHDLLNALHKPEWPAAEFLLSILGNMLIKHYRASKGTEIGLRTASLEYLGLITAQLKKDARSGAEDAKARLELVVKTVIFDEMEDPPADISELDIDDMSATDRIKKLEQALIDYLLITKDGGDVSIEYAVSFYACYWYKETVEDLDRLKQDYKAMKKQEDLTEKDLRKREKKMERINEKARAMKEYLVKLVERKQMKKRVDEIRAKGLDVMLEADAAWAVKFLATQRELTQSGFENYLKQILYGVISEPIVALRTRAMKCLTQIIEADHAVLGIPEVQSAVQARMVDPNAQVREATIELLGKYLLSRPDFIPKYYPILLERIKDSGTAVRKRVIRIMRELIEQNPDFDKGPELLSRIVRRIGDEEGVKKLVLETFNNLWFQPLREKDHEALLKRVQLLTATTELCAAENTVEHIETMFNLIFKTGDKGTIFACRQIVDSLVDSVLTLESKMAIENSISAADTNGGGDNLNKVRLAKSNQDRMLACLTALSLFSKVRSELLVKHAETLQPYLSMSVNTPGEIQVLKQVIDMLRRVIPLMTHPSDQLIDDLEESLAQLIVGGKVVIVESAVECAGALHEKFPRRRPKVTERFLKFLGVLNQTRQLTERDPKAQSQMNDSRVVMLARAIFCVGLLGRYFDFDVLLEEEQDTTRQYVVPTVLPDNPFLENHQIEDDERPRKIRDNVFSVLVYFATFPHGVIKKNSITSIGHLSAQYAEYLTRPEVRGLYMMLLKSNDIHHLALKILVLRNLEQFLINEETKMHKLNQDWMKRKETEDLKEMDQAGSGLGSAVIQIYWNFVLNCYFHREKEVRSAAVQVAWRTLNQGLVTPGSSIPTLIAMMTDPIPLIRNKVENLLKEIDTKYQGMVQTKAVSGIRVAFSLHNLVGRENGRLLRGIRAIEGSATANTANKKMVLDAWGMPKYTNDGQALLSGLYQAMRGNRQQRRSFLASVLRLFSEEYKDKPSLQEWIFVGDNVAMFPYQVLDEPLYVIHQIDSIVALSGESIINQFKQSDDDVDFEPEAIYLRLPSDKTHLFTLMNNSQACFTLLFLKTFLMKLYGFTEAKIQEYSPSDGAKIYEKPVTRKNVQMFYPQTAIAELDPARIAVRDTMDGHYNLSHQICHFRKMLLSLDRGGDDDDEAPPEEQPAPENEQVDEADQVDGVITEE
ncbi:unnamed protein product, partial [Mesorhabditis spiculigera]